MDSFPFYFNQVHGGFTAVTGLCRLEEGGIHCEFQYDVGGLGLKSKVKEASLPFSAIQGCRYRKGWWGGKVIVEMKSLREADAFPWNEENEIEFLVKRRNRDRAEVVASEIDLQCAEWRRRKVAAEE